MPRGIAASLKLLLLRSQELQVGACSDGQALPAERTLLELMAAALPEGEDRNARGEREDRTRRVRQGEKDLNKRGSPTIKISGAQAALR